jgi:signal transduction histidine kinase
MVLAAIDRERQRIGTQLHEKACQTLAGISIQAGLLTHRAQRGESVAADEIQQLALHIQKAIEEVRAISHELRAGELPGGNLIEALAHLAEVTAHHRPCEFVCEKPVFVRDSAHAAAIFCIAEECVRNALRHAASKRIVLCLTETSRTIKLTIDDDGIGFAPPLIEERLGGIGLMRRRARASGGKLTIKSRMGAGTVVSCTWPKGD